MDVLRTSQVWARASSDGFRFETNTTSAWDNELKFAAAESVRTSIIVLSCFNTVAGFVTAAGILWQSWMTARKIDSRWNFRSSWCQLICSPEVFPFVLSCGTTVQGIVFSISQSKGLQSLMILGCTRISQFMLPAFFIAPFIQVAFGLELAIRALKRRPFPARGRWNTLACLTAVGLGLLITFVITIVLRPPNFCFACLVWYLRPFSLGCFAIFIVVVVILTIEVSVVFFKLMKATKLGPMERVEASRMVYFLVVAIVSNTIVIPFFFSVTFRDPDSPETLNSSMVAAVVVNLSGLLTGSLYLYLRSSRTTTIGPNDWDGIEPRPFEKGFSDGGSSNFDFGLQIAQPISPPSQTRRDPGATPDTLDIMRGLEAPQSGSLHVPSLGIICPPTNLPTSPEPARVSRMSTLKSLKKSWHYKMPVAVETPLLPKSSFVLPTSTYAPPPPSEEIMLDSTDNLLAPPQIREPTQAYRQRGSSMVSSATVQIGLRLSNLGDMPPPTATMPGESSKVHDLLDYPIIPASMPPKKPSPLGITVITLPDDEAMEEEQWNKDLPPVPARSKAREQDKDDAVTLSPDVYSPPEIRPLHSRQGSRSSHRSRKPSVSSRAPHSRQGSRNGPEVIREEWI